MRKARRATFNSALIMCVDNKRNSADGQDVNRTKGIPNQMQLIYFRNGGYVAHKYRLAGYTSKFSVWFNIDGYAIDAERIDAKNRSYPVARNSAAWHAIERYKLAGHENATEIARRASLV